jgi:hypothetical protein
MAYEGPDFREDYMAGVYDGPCPECKGRTTVAVVVERDSIPADLQGYYDEWQRSEDCMADLRAMEEAERRFGC